MKKCIKMYENKYKNPDLSSSEELESFLQLIADLDEDIELFAMGGTAMVLKDIKAATKDIDFMTTSSYEEIKRLFELAGLKEETQNKLRFCGMWRMANETRIDIFFDEFIAGIPLPDDCRDLSEYLKTIGKLKLYILNWYDILITKIARSENRDIDDIKEIINKENIDFKKLKKRYYELAETSLINHYDYKFKCIEKQIK